MYFQLSKLILWPRLDAEPRVVDFELGVVNVISGASKTGKSAVIPIIDYCLGSEKCTVPVGVIRENCTWFGVIINTIEGQKLLARRAPGDQQSTGDMYFIEGPNVDVPRRIEGKSHNLDSVKASLNRLAGLTNLGFDPSSEDSFKSRPSFRDLMAFNFQPQNIVANPDVMYFKADTNEHREKLKTIFPYVLNAVTAEVLQARFELDQVNRNLRRKESELRALVAANTAWQAEAQAWGRQAIELGVLDADRVLPAEWSDVLDLLREIAKSKGSSARPSLRGLDSTLGRLDDLRTQETAQAAALAEHRQRLNELRRLRESADAFGASIYIQRDRLALAKWLKELTVAAPSESLVAVGRGGRDELLFLCDNLEEIEVKLRAQPTLSDTLDKETHRVRVATEEALNALNETRAEIANLERRSEAAQAAGDHFDRTERFLGRVEQALVLYDRADQSSTLRDEIAKLRARADELQRTIAEAGVQRKLRNATTRVESAVNRFVPQLDAEWKDAPVQLAIDDLTIKVVRGTRSDFLWEIGSGANWLAYHIATTLALQEFFLSETNHCVPYLLVYDQPSQVYFPKRAATRDDDRSIDPQFRDEEDVQAVRKVFALLGQQAVAHKGRLQIVILDHAGEDVWGGLPGVRLIEEWRGPYALVPREWYQSQA